MKGSVTLGVFVAAAAAIDLVDLEKQLPACALGCLAEGVTQHGCLITDFVCQCSNIEPIIKTVSPCLAKAGCSLENITTTGRVVLNVCKQLPANATETASSAPTPTPTEQKSTAAKYCAGWIGLMAVAAAVFV